MPPGAGAGIGVPLAPCHTRPPRSPRSHDFIGEFATSYRELSRAQSQFTVYEVRGARPGGRFQGCWEPHSGTCPCPQVLNPRKKCKKKKYVNSGTVSGAGALLGLLPAAGAWP